MSDRDYVLGTQDDEIERLGLQHRVWRSSVLDAFRRAGISAGQIVLDVGAGPGFAAQELGELVGPEGRVIALERSRRFLDALEARAEQIGLANIETREIDVAESDFPAANADASWCRWVLSFVANPQRTVRNIAAALKPGGVAIFHEYADYGAWRLMPPNPDMERFRELVIRSWRDSGGEPDVALNLPGWLTASGFEILEIRPLIHIVRRSDPMWEWPASFVAVNARRLHELGYASEEEAGRFAVSLSQAGPDALMITPLVAEVIARKKG